MAGDNAAYAEASVESLKTAGLPFTILDAAQGALRFPQMSWEGVRWAILEHEAGYLRARRACQAVWEAVAAEGGATLTANVNPDNPPVEADAYVYATGPWLGAMFPDLLGEAITPTRQEIFYFGTPAGDSGFDETRFPAWVDDSGPRFYGIPGNQWRGFKAGRDITGERVDPTSMDRQASAEELERVRLYLGRRFPALAGTPLVESRVCQYEMSPDGDLIVDRHPERPSLWIVGGGSGHSFKFAPALGEHIVDLVLERAVPDPRFSLHRLTGASGVGERK
jgi:glycine/D-amino acid oxidase-like deaminating enzyme